MVCPRVCVSTLTRVPRVDLWLRACVCALVCITAQRTACPGPAHRARRVKVFAFREGLGGGTLPSRPQERITAQETHEENSENQANSSGHLLLFGSRIAYRRKNFQSSTVTLGVWSVVCLAFAPGGCWLTASWGGPLRHQGPLGRSHWAWRPDLVSSVPGALPCTRGPGAV